MDIREIEQEIERLEARPTSYTQCEKLAILHAVRDRYREPEEPAPNLIRSTYSYAPAPASEFLAAADGVPVDRMLEILDAHFDCIRALYPKEYDAIIRRLNSAKQ